MPLYDENGNWLNDDEIFELCKTEEGKAKAKRYIMAARIGYAASSVYAVIDEWNILMRDLSQEEQQSLARVIWYCLFTASQAEVSQHLLKVAEQKGEVVFDDQMTIN